VRVVVEVLTVKPPSATTATLIVVVPVVAPNCASAEAAANSRAKAVRARTFFMVLSP
jgi:hypothetical protein